ncbi:MAG: hypothetical protein ABL995_03170 [Bryobacteraceae bacterium]
MLKSSFFLTLCAGLLPCYAADFLTGQAARAVIGQGTFVTQTTNATEGTFGGVGGLAFAGNTLYATDANRLGLGNNNNRVLMFGNLRDTLPGPLDEIQPNTSRCPLCAGVATTVLGDKDADSVPVEATTQSGLRLPTGVASDGTNVAVADTGNNRVLLWKSIPNTRGQKADIVLGQADFVTQAVPAASASSLRGPQGVWLQNGKLFVADTGNNRVLIWNSIPTRNNQPADLVLGQPNFTSTTPQQIVDQDLPTAASNLLSPTSVTSDGTRLYVSDLGFNRVLIWNSIPTKTQQPADVEIGQKDMTKSVANDSANLCPANGADSDNNPTYPARCDKTLNFPRFVLSDGKRLFIADGGNDRVLVYNTIPTSNAAAADVVLGQPDFASDIVTNPSGFTFSADPTTVSAANVTPTPTSLAWDGTNLYVADATDYRILVFTPGEQNVPTNGVVNFASRDIYALASITIGGTIVPGNVVNLSITTESGSLTITPSGPTLSGGSGTTKASGGFSIAAVNIIPDNVASVFIGGTKYSYTVASGDTVNTVATGLVNIINAANSNAGDPKVTVSASDALITVTARDSGAAGNNVTIVGNAYTYTVQDTDSLDNVAKSLANAINTANSGAGDPNVNAIYVTNQATILLVARTPGEDGNSINISTAASTGAVTLTASPTSSTLEGGTGTVSASASVTIDGTTVTGGNIITVTIAGTSYTYKVLTGDTFTSIAASVAKAINASNAGAGDPNVTVTTNGSNVVLTARTAGSTGDSITLGAGVSAAGTTTATASASTLTGGANSGNLSPGAFITIRGTNLADYAAAANQSSEQLPWELAGAQVYIDGNRAPLFYASPTSINAQMPWEVVNSTSVSVYVRTRHLDGTVTVSNAIASPLSSGQPGLFAIDGQEPRVVQAYHNSSFATGTVNLSGQIQTGDVPQITIEDRLYTYTVSAGNSIKLTSRLAGTPGNSITYSASISGSSGTTISAAGSSLTGGNTATQATGLVTLSGSAPPSGATLTITVNGNAYTYTAVSDETLSSAAFALANTVNNAQKNEVVNVAPTNGDTLFTVRDSLINKINSNPEETVTAAANGVGTGIRLVAKVPGPEGNGIPIAVTVTTADTNTGGALITLTSVNGIMCCANVAGSPVTRANPALPGETIFVYATGLGLVCTLGNISPNDCASPDPAKDALVTGGKYRGPAANAPSNVLTPNIAGGTAITVSAGIVPGSFGIYQVVIELPLSLAENPLARIYLQQGFATSNVATIPIGPALQ